MTSHDLISIFKDTQRLINNDPLLLNRMLKCQSSSRLYLDGYTSPIHRIKGCREVEVIESTAFQCARDAMKTAKKIAVLNFANPHEPGGGVLRGVMAQEECLCRCSDLYNVLAQPYFQKHYYQYHYHNCDYCFSDRLIYSPNVTVIKSDDQIPQILDKPFSVDVITCAAPYLFEYVEETDEELLLVYKSRIRNILEVAMSHEVDFLILGAFGCGAFHNNPVLMAKAFSDLLIHEKYAKYFERVIFAIKRKDAFCNNLSSFEKAFCGVSI